MASDWCTEALHPSQEDVRDMYDLLLPVWRSSDALLRNVALSSRYAYSTDTFRVTAHPDVIDAIVEQRTTGDTELDALIAELEYSRVVREDAENVELFPTRPICDRYLHSRQGFSEGTVVWMVPSFPRSEDITWMLYRPRTDESGPLLADVHVAARDGGLESPVRYRHDFDGQ
jgi:hypothetical protein